MNEKPQFENQNSFGARELIKTKARHTKMNSNACVISSKVVSPDESKMGITFGDGGFYKQPCKTKRDVAEQLVIKRSSLDVI